MPDQDYKAKYYDLLERYNSLIEDRIRDHNSDIARIKYKLSEIIRFLDKSESLNIINASTNKVNSDFIQTLLVKMEVMDEKEAFEMASRIRNTFHSQWAKKKDDNSEEENLDPHPSTTR